MLFLLLSFFVSLGAQAQSQPHGFSCYGSGAAEFDINFEGGRYADWIKYRDSTGDSIRPLLHPQEQTEDIRDANLGITLEMNSCARGTGDTLVTCTKPFAMMSNYSFSYGRQDPLNPAYNEQVTFQREIAVSNLSLVVTKQPEHQFNRDTEVAQLHLTFDASSASGKVHYDITRRLGEWTNATNRSNYDRCIFH